MGLNDTPSGDRLHIGFFGRRNAGKSSVVNAVTGQDLAVVSGWAAFGAFVAVWFLSDYTSRTVQHEITKGYSRTEIFFSKESVD